MAQLVIAAAGAAIGGAIAPGVVAFGLTGAAIGWQAGALLGSAFVKGPNVQGPRLNDLRVTGTEYGQPIPWVAGAPRIAGQIAWASNKREIANTQKVGKGGGQKVTSYTYEVDLLILLTENEIDGISRIWSNGELVFNGIVTKDGVWNSLAIYTGAADQLPDPTYEAAVGSGNAPAYRGHGYVVIQGLQLGNSGQIPNLTFETRESSAVIDDRIRLLTSFEDSSSEDLSVYAIGPGSQINGALTGGAFRCDFGAFAQNQISWTDTGLEGVNSAPVTYEVLFRVVRNNSPAQIDFLRFKKGSPGSPDYRLTLGVTGSGVGGQIVWLEEGPGLGSFSPIYYADPDRATTLGQIHFALIVFPDDTATVYYRGSRIRNRVPFDANSVNPTGLVTLGGTSGVTRDLVVEFDAVRVARAEVYTGATITPPTDLGGNLTNASVSFGEAEKPLFEVIDLLMSRAGYSSDDWDTSAIEANQQNVKGMAISQVSATRTILEQLQTVYFFESAKSDKIYFFPRSQSPVASIGFDDLGCSGQPESGEKAFEIVTANELEVPSQVALTYPNVLGDYNNATEYSQRLDSSQDSTQTIGIPIGLTPEDAKGVADALLFDQMASLTKANIRVPVKYARLEPGDVINVTNSDGRQYRMRIGKKDDELVYSAFELTIDDAGALNSAALTDGGYVITDTVRQLSPSLWEAMDIPLLSDRDNEPGFYVAISPQPSTEPFDWPGAAFARSFSAENYVNEFITDTRCVVGTCETTLGNWTGRPVFDESNGVTVAVSGELSSTTRSAMLADLSVNMCLIGDELVRFRLAEFLGAASGFNRYRLTGLLRGQRGTEQFQTGHVASERFVLLDGALRSIIDQNGQIGAATEVKAVTLNLLLSSVTGEAFTSNSVRLRPFSVANLRALADGADLDITWQRRTRLSYRYGGPMGGSVLLGEASELYRVRIFDGATLVRTVDVTTASYTYTASNAAADGFSSLDTATIQVNQISEIVGEGFPAQTTGVIP